MMNAALQVVASIPSPGVSYFDIGPLRIHFYALCIILGIIVAVFLTNARLTKRGAEPWVVIDICLLAIPIAIIGARIFHVLTHPGFYFGEGSDFWAIFRIWEGGIAIYGALIGGAVGAWLGCRWTGIRFWTFADALAPGMLIAQALGRFGNWFNQELFGLPTTLPWGLEISPDNPAWPVGLPAGTLFHPTFAYEVVWNLLGAAVLLWVSKKFITLQWGRVFALYLIWYSAGRVVWESIRVDPTEIFLGLRVNVWWSIFAIVLGLVIFLAQKKRHPGLEPSPYMPGRGWSGAPAVVHSQNSESDFVDVSEPPVGKHQVAAKSTAHITK
ncbi:MAG TPA: prolipoprotein diacylglyceryl transferase [Microbacteriaceae bacterium]|jgi:prolipoprotein diacylglyceryl transferase|nr:prolipoprotein diacylglyceryl transferase [Microbacteriaceae bacterium]HQX36242.1 prolipoprotein diacylglyceryl transferase [Microbacteriaceae bacterium]